MSCIAIRSLIIALLDFLPFPNIVWFEMRVTAIIKYNNAKIFYISTCFISLIYFVCLRPIIYFTNYIDITWLVIIGHNIYLTVLPIFIFHCFFSSYMTLLLYMLIFYASYVSLSKWCTDVFMLLFFFLKSVQMCMLYLLLTFCIFIYDLSINVFDIDKMTYYILYSFLFFSILFILSFFFIILFHYLFVHYVFHIHSYFCFTLHIFVSLFHTCHFHCDCFAIDVSFLSLFPFSYPRIDFVFSIFHLHLSTHISNHYCFFIYFICFVCHVNTSLLSSRSWFMSWCPSGFHLVSVITMATTSSSIHPSIPPSPILPASTFLSKLQVLTGDQQDTTMRVTEDMLYDSVDFDLNMSGLTCTVVQYVCVEFRKGGTPTTIFNLIPVPDPSVLVSCSPAECEGLSLYRIYLRKGNRGVIIWGS